MYYSNLSFLSIEDVSDVGSTPNPLAFLGEIIGSAECYNSSLSSCILGTTSSDDCLGAVGLSCISGEMSL